MGAYRNYSDDDKAAVLAYYDACGNAEKTARAFSMPSATVKLWNRERDVMVSAPTKESIEHKKRDLAAMMEQLAISACDHTLKTIEDASPAQAATVMGIAVDKMRLLRGESTSISERKDPASIEERDKKALELIERAQARLKVVGGGA